jgi:hypothetical protein
VRIEVAGRAAKLYLNGSAKPSLVVDGMKGEDLHGAVGLWSFTDEEAYFSNVRITPAVPQNLKNESDVARGRTIRRRMDSEAERVSSNSSIRSIARPATSSGLRFSSALVYSTCEAALVIFLIRGVAHEPIPAVIDGLRTRTRESSRFRAGLGDEQPRRGCSVGASTPSILKK